MRSEARPRPRPARGPAPPPYLRWISSLARSCLRTYCSRNTCVARLRSCRLSPGGGAASLSHDLSAGFPPHGLRPGGAPSLLSGRPVLPRPLPPPPPAHAERCRTRQRTDDATHGEYENGRDRSPDPHAPNPVLQKRRIRNAALQNASDVLFKGIRGFGQNAEGRLFRCLVFLGAEQGRGTQGMGSKPGLLIFSCVQLFAALPGYTSFNFVPIIKFLHVYYRL